MRSHSSIRCRHAAPSSRAGIGSTTCLPALSRSGLFRCGESLNGDRLSHDHGILFVEDMLGKKVAIADTRPSWVTTTTACTGI